MPSLGSLNNWKKRPIHRSWLSWGTNHPDTQALDTAELRQSWRVLECAGDNSLARVIKELTRKGTVLDMILKNKQELFGDVMVGSALAAVTMR